MNRKRRRIRAEQPSEPSSRQEPAAKRRLSIGKKLLFSSIVLILFLVAIELGLAVAGWRPLIDDEDPYVGFHSWSPLFVERGQDQMVTAENKLTWFNSQRFAKNKPGNTYRVFSVGGSTTYGHPYDDDTSFSGWLRELLPEIDDSRRWEVINAGGISYASYRVANVVKEALQYDPDLIVIYTGHNEFLEARTYGKLKETPSWMMTLGGLLSQTRTYAVAHRLVNQSRPAAAKHDAQSTKDLLPSEVNTLLDSAVGPQVYHRDDQQRREIVEHFEFNIRRMVDMARNSGVKVILVTPASNLAKCSPFKSEHRADLQFADQQAWNALAMRTQEQIRAGDMNGALQSVEQSIRIDPRFAEALYLRGQVLAAMGNTAEAKQSFVAARDEDICALRAPSEIIEAVRRVASDAKTPLVDYVVQLDEASPGGLPGDNLFLDHVHPTIEGYQALASSLVQAMQQVGDVRGTGGPDPAAVAAAAARVGSRVNKVKHGQALRNLSKVFHWAGKKAEADRLALQAIELTPDDPDTIFQAGNALMRQGQFDAAIELFHRILEIKPEYSATVNASLGYAYSQKGDQAKAMSHLRESLRLNPEFADAHYNLATILESSGELDSAAHHYGKTIAGYPRHPTAHARLGIVLSNLQRWNEARARLETAVGVDPNSLEARLHLGLVAARQGAAADAREQFRWILQRIPDHEVAGAELKKLE